MPTTRTPLKKMTFKHKEVARRLLMNQDKVEIAMATGYALSYLDFLAGDPLFRQEMDIMEAELHEHFVQQKVDAMDELHDASMAAARISIKAMNGTMIKPVLADNEEAVPIPKRLDCAWDVLDRTGNRAPSKSIQAHISLSDMVIKAYEKRHGKKISDEEDSIVGQVVHRGTSIL